LGGAKAKSKPNTSLADTLAGEWEDGDEVENAWGTEDLIDVNADGDDWAAFESAPIPEVVVPKAQSYYIKPDVVTQPSPPKVKAKPASTSTTAPPTPLLAPKPVVAAAVVPASYDDWGDGGDGRDGVDVPLKSSTPAAGLAGLSKEDKDKEMARRREERKARIAAMKGQKK
jgi:SCY1-like protein 1